MNAITFFLRAQRSEKVYNTIVGNLFFRVLNKFNND
jgi:hypothetical protein